MHNVKKITSHGSVSIPVHIRRGLNIREKDAMDMSVNEKGEIVISPHNPRCVFCGTIEDVTLWHGKWICFGCAEAVYEKLKKEVREDGAG